jgi:bacterioferritin-associated ferredoxin
MRQQWIGAVAAAAALSFFAGQTRAAAVEVKGLHICCGQCVNVAKKILAKVDGVSDAAGDKDSKTVTFAATDDKAAKAGIKALLAGGFYGEATIDGKETKVAGTPKKGGKADEITVKGVHSCCAACRKALTKAFADSKVSFSGKGPQQDVTISGKDLDKGETIEALRKAGFNGTIAK